MVLMYCDLETTGLDPKKDSIVQLAGIITDGKNEEEFNWNIKPYRPYELSHGARWKTGFTEELLDSFPNQIEIYSQFIDLLDKYLEGKNERIYFCGYNSTSFDMAFMRDWFEFNDNKKFGAYFYFPSIDAMHLAAFYLMGRRANMINFQLETVFEEIMGYRMENAHDALADIKATRKLISKLASEFINGMNAGCSVPQTSQVTPTRSTRPTRPLKV